VLHGLPTAIKDLFDFTPGWPATFGGIRALKDFTLDISCAFAERIQRAGAIVLGKTNSPIMGFRGTCDNYLFGPSRNPFATAKITGGSSKGSAAAVADGLLPLAEGTDGGGSIRIPASWCGVYGYKASFGRIPYLNRPNAFAGVNPFLFEGPITRTVEDAALALDALAGHDSRDPFSLDAFTLQTYGHVIPGMDRDAAATVADLILGLQKGPGTVVPDPFANKAANNGRLSHSQMKEVKDERPAQ
jgi:amidase